MERQTELTEESKPPGPAPVSVKTGGSPAVSVAQRTALGVLTALGVGLVLWLDSLWKPGYVLAAGGLAVVVMATDEFCRLVNGSGGYVSRGWVVFAGAALFLVQWAGWAFKSFPDPWVTGAAFICVSAAAILCGRVLRSRVSFSQEALGLGLAGVIYVPFLFGFVVGVRARWGAAGLVVLLATCKSGSSAAYFVGKYLGRHRLAPAVSPAKTVEGAVGAVACSVLVAVLLSAVTPWRIMGPTVSLLYGVLVALAAIAGDLAESILKRQSALKDSGGLLSGFGGMLDMVDDVLFAAPLSFFFFSYFAG